MNLSMKTNNNLILAINLNTIGRKPKNFGKKIFFEKIQIKSCLALKIN
jgi:hypothetical protein